MKKFNLSYKNHNLYLQAIAMGNDWNISIFGGDSPHIGAVAIGIPRPSLQHPDQTSSSTSVITVTGHKEDDLARKAASYLSSRLNSVVTVSAGIHLNNISLSDLSTIDTLVTQLCQDFLNSFTKKKNHPQ